MSGVGPREKSRFWGTESSLIATSPPPGPRHFHWEFRAIIFEISLFSELEIIEDPVSGINGRTWTGMVCGGLREVFRRK